MSDTPRSISTVYAVAIGLAIGIAAGAAIGLRVVVSEARADAYFRGVRDARDGLVRIKVRGGVEFLSHGKQTETSEN